PPEIARAAMLTNANELKGVAFTFIIDLAVLQKHIGPGEGRCAFFVVCEIILTMVNFLVKRKVNIS
ncbi:hypothetical protein ACX0AN_003026, partial [Acinetobacter baumannii]|uniref:hypothetical protein n=2 Tax=Acinetobacter TaxID=469 RepID=UPI001C073FBD